MNTKELCLGTLLLGDASGYEIKGMFENAFRHFQRISYGSIYPALNSLADDGLVDFTSEVQSGRPDKKIYSITPKGRLHFATALNKAEPKESFQSDFLTLILFSNTLTPERLKEVFHAYISQLSKDLEDLHGLLEDDSDCPPFQARFTIEFGIHTIGAQLDFIQQRQQELFDYHRQNNNSGAQQ